jgi:hypothetical protein
VVVVAKSLQHSSTGVVMQEDFDTTCGVQFAFVLFSQPTLQPIIRMTCTYLEGLTQPSATCKLFNV